MAARRMSREARQISGVEAPAPATNSPPFQAASACDRNA